MFKNFIENIDINDTEPITIRKGLLSHFFLIIEKKACKHCSWSNQCKSIGCLVYKAKLEAKDVLNTSQPNEEN